MCPNVLESYADFFSGMAENTLQKSDEIEANL
jgi:hypothetical protein